MRELNNVLHSTEESGNCFNTYQEIRNVTDDRHGVPLYVGNILRMHEIMLHKHIDHPKNRFNDNENFNDRYSFYFFTDAMCRMFKRFTYLLE